MPYNPTAVLSNSGGMIRGFAPSSGPLASGCGGWTLPPILLSGFYTSIKVNEEGAKRFAREMGVFITSRYPSARYRARK